MASKGTSATPSEQESPSDTLQSQSLYSTKTESETGSGSGRSVASDMNEREEDFTKDNSASPVDLECGIQAERITKILNEALTKIKETICLPRLVYDGTLRAVLNVQSYEEVLAIYNEYDNVLISASCLSVSAIEDIKNGNLSMKNRLSPELSHLIYILNNCPALKTFTNKIVDEVKEKKMSHEILTNPILEYLLLFEHFRELMVRQLTWTAADDLGAKILTRKLETSNEKLKNRIKELSESLIKEKEEFEKTLEMRAQIMANLEHDLSMQNYEATQKLNKNILDSERQMVLMTRAHTVREELLKEEEENTRDGYRDILNRNMKDEKVQRQRRFKVETQLLSWIQKYDTEMSDKQIEFDEFESKFEDEKERVRVLEEELIEQDKKYIPLIAEREAEYAEEMTRKMNTFMKEHAARILQTAWRQVLDNRKEKKKLKRMLRKIKEAEKKAEAAALAKFQREQRIAAARAKKEKKEAKEAAKAAKQAERAARAAAKAEAEKASKKK